MKLAAHNNIRSRATVLVILLLILLVISNVSNVNKDPFDTPLTQDEQSVLKLKKDDPNAKRNNFDLIQRSAVPSDKLTIKNCGVRPVTLLLKLGQPLELVNLDQISRTIETDRQHKFRVPAKSSIKITADFGHGAGIYGVECDEQGRLEGMFVVENE